MSHVLSRFALQMAVVSLSGLLAGCASHEVVRGADDPSVDQPAMSTSLDRQDMDRTLQSLLNKLRVAAIMTSWREAAGRNDRQTVSVAPFINETTEHIDPQLDAMLGDTETWLSGAGIVRLVSHERQAEAIEEVEHTNRNAIFDRNHIPQYGKQLGVKFFITGKVGAADERTEDARRVQYFIFMQVIDAETSEIRWQDKAYVTKAIR
jgi:PBP1b-binding outer membrane lipoprotein LpoB